MVLGINFQKKIKSRLLSNFHFEVFSSLGTLCPHPSSLIVFYIVAFKRKLKSIRRRLICFTTFFSCNLLLEKNCEKFIQIMWIHDDIAGKVSIKSVPLLDLNWVRQFSEKGYLLDLKFLNSVSNFYKFKNFA